MTGASGDREGTISISSPTHLKRLPPAAPIQFVPKELRRALKDQDGKVNRNAWEMGLALAIKDVLRSGDLYLTQSKQYLSFWDLTMSESHWQEEQATAFDDLQQPRKHEAKTAPHRPM